MKNIVNKLIRGVTAMAQSKKQSRHALVGPPRLWKMKREFQIKFLREMGMQPGHQLFEFGCGTLRGGIPLIAYLDAGHYFGLEVREAVLNEGRKELREARLEKKMPTLLLSDDMSKLTVDQEFDYMWAFSVLIHMNDQILHDTLAFVRSHLSEGGAFYANVGLGEGQEGHWQGFPVVARSFEFYRQACAANGLVVSDLGRLKDLGHRSGIESQDNQTMLKIVALR